MVLRLSRRHSRGSCGHCCDSYCRCSTNLSFAGSACPDEYTNWQVVQADDNHVPDFWNRECISWIVCVADLRYCLWSDYCSDGDGNFRRGSWGEEGLSPLGSMCMAL